MSLTEKLKSILEIKKDIKNILNTNSLNITENTSFRDYSKSISKLVNKENLLKDVVEKKITKLSKDDLSGITCIGYNVFSNSKLQEVTLSEDVTEIEGFAFAASGDLTIFNTNFNLQKIGSFSFKDCTKLESIIIPISVKTIANSSFIGCNNLTIYCEAPSRQEGWAIDWNWRDTNANTIPVVWDYLSTSIEETGILYSLSDTFLSATPIKLNDISLKTIIIPEYITKNNVSYKTSDNIPYGFFASNTVIETLEIPKINDEFGRNGLQNGRLCDLWAVGGSEEIPAPIKNITFRKGIIANYSCQEAPYLENVIIEDDVTDIGRQAFYDCPNLKSVIIGNGVQTINNSTFCNCINLKELIIGNNIKKICKQSFMGSGLEMLNIPNNVEIIEEVAFASCDNLISVNIPNSVISLGEKSFSGCDNLEDVIIGDGITEISNETFAYCEKLKGITLGKNIKSIGKSAFHMCGSLTEIHLPKSIESIEGDAFAYCGNPYLTPLNIYIPKSEGSIEGAPWGATNATVHWNCQI